MKTLEQMEERLHYEVHTLIRDAKYHAPPQAVKKHLKWLKMELEDLMAYMDGEE